MKEIAQRRRRIDGVMRRKNRSNGKIVQFGGRQVELLGEEKKRKEKRKRKIENNDASFDGVYTIRVYGFELGIYIWESIGPKGEARSPFIKTRFHGLIGSLLPQ